MRVRRRPKMPTLAEREQHEATHMPFRSWCRHCVRGRGRNSPHWKRMAAYEEAKEAGQVPKVSMDYHFMSQADECAGKNPLLIMVDESTGESFARAVGKKGAGQDRDMEWMIKSVVDELEAWGHRGQDIIIKCDQENSIEAVRKAITDLRVGRTIPESPPKGESQANGRVEEAGKRIREYVRTDKDQIEFGTGARLETDSPVLQWIVRWAAMAHSRFSIGSDGKSAHERRKGRKCRTEVVPVG